MLPVGGTGRLRSSEREARTIRNMDGRIGRFPSIDPMNERDELDAIVIGAGEAGAMVASLAVEAGARVALLYREPWGSTCLNVGCVPSKFLIHRARVAHVTRTAGRFGIHASEPRVDLPTIVSEMLSMIDDDRAASLSAARTTPGLDLVEGAARFHSSNEVQVGERVLQADRIFIATGMRSRIPSVPGIENGPYLTNENVMELTEVPEHLIILGGGYIGCELGQAFRRFGSRVTIVQRGDRLVCEEDEDASTVLRRAFEAEGIEVLTGTDVRSVTWSDGRPDVSVRGAGVDGDQALKGTHLLVATGRRPNTDSLDLGRAGVETDARGFIPVDEGLTTNVPGIWAVGDVNGRQPFTRVCQEEGKVAFANAFLETDVRMQRHFLPHAIFTDPEVGSVGLTKDRAVAEGHDVVAGLVPFERVEKAKLIGETTGFIKYVAEKRTHRLLGCHVVGAAGADLVYDAVVVMRAGGRIDDLATAVGVFPTLQEGMEGAARGLLRRDAPKEVAGPLVSARHLEGGEDNEHHDV
jgi:pyruvate/2-oxoglutarate dehydrogenase complex dihydrolipoamide dehydrogenase (E3) component